MDQKQQPEEMFRNISIYLPFLLQPTIAPIPFTAFMKALKHKKITTTSSD